jgi:hypothetical protein
VAEDKKKSGAANRKARKANESEADRCERVREEAGFDTAELLKMEAPPDNAIGRITWAQKLLAKALHAVTCDPAMKFETKLRYIEGYTKAMGLTHAKAVVEERIKGLEKKAGIAAHQHDDDGLEPDPEA